MITTFNTSPIIQINQFRWDTKKLPFHVNETNITKRCQQYYIFGWQKQHSKCIRWTGYRIGWQCESWCYVVYSFEHDTFTFIRSSVFGKMNGSSAPNMSFVHLIRNIERYMTCTLLFCAWCWTPHSQMSKRMKVFRCVQCSVCLQFILLQHLLDCVVNFDK